MHVLFSTVGYLFQTHIEIAIEIGIECSRTEGISIPIQIWMVMVKSRGGVSLPHHY